MANAKNNAPANTPKGSKKKSGNKMRVLTIIVMLGFMAPFIIPTLMLAAFGMMPTLVALFADKDEDKSSTAAVAAMNFAGITPFIIDLWIKGQHMSDTWQILREPTSWLVMLGAAGIGQMIVFAIPQMMTSFSLNRAEVRMKILKGNLDQLRASWGPDVATTKPMDKVINKE